MASGFFPPGNYPLSDFFEMIINVRFGEGYLRIKMNVAIWESYSDDIESAREEIRLALEAGTLTAYFWDSRGKEMQIPKSDWIIPPGDSFAESYFTLSQGNLQHGGDAKSRGNTVYVRKDEADKFLGKEAPTRRGPKPKVNWEIVKRAAKEVLDKNPTMTRKDLVMAREVRMAINPKLKSDLLSACLSPAAYAQECGISIGTVENNLRKLWKDMPPKKEITPDKPLPKKLKVTK
ncbi:MAG: hypothetical protein ACE5EK_05515 [Nitrospinales bacterium]